MRVHNSSGRAIPEARLRSFLERVLDIEASSAQADLVLVDDVRMIELHHRFLGIAEPTDVLAFPLSEGPEDPFLGEIYVSVDTAQRVAADRRICPDRELALYSVHGLLHLLGFDDKKAADRRIMITRQEDLLRVGWDSEEPRSTRFDSLLRGP